VFVVDAEATQPRGACGSRPCGGDGLSCWLATSESDKVARKNICPCDNVKRSADIPYVLIPTSIDFDTSPSPRHGRESGHPRLSSQSLDIADEPMKRLACMSTAIRQFKPESPNLV